MLLSISPEIPNGQTDLSRVTLEHVHPARVEAMMRSQGHYQSAMMQYFLTLHYSLLSSECGYHIKTLFCAQLAMLCHVPRPFLAPCICPSCALQSALGWCGTHCLGSSKSWVRVPTSCLASSICPSCALELDMGCCGTHCLGSSKSWVQECPSDGKLGFLPVHYDTL